MHINLCKSIKLMLTSVSVDIEIWKKMFVECEPLTKYKLQVASYIFYFIFYL